MFKQRTFLLLIAVLGGMFSTYAQSLSLKNATILVSPSVPVPMRETAPKVLTEEINKRTQLLLKPATAWPKTGVTVAMALSSDRELFGKALPARKAGDAAETRAEGFRVVVDGQTLWIIGADARGVLFGTGWVLRHLEMSAGNALLAPMTDVATAPAYPIRGHQLGYRHTANSY
ncbi:MAG TPA: hypothetical protein DCM71_02845, partial [Runella sp.]|nr:hypothetical protein [Runella sp.]